MMYFERFQSTLKCCVIYLLVVVIGAGCTPRQKSVDAPANAPTNNAIVRKYLENVSRDGSTRKARADNGPDHMWPSEDERLDALELVTNYKVKKAHRYLTTAGAKSLKRGLSLSELYSVLVKNENLTPLEDEALTDGWFVVQKDESYLVVGWLATRPSEPKLGIERRDDPQWQVLEGGKFVALNAAAARYTPERWSEKHSLTASEEKAVRDRFDAIIDSGVAPEIERKSIEIEMPALSNRERSDALEELWAWEEAQEERAKERVQEELGITADDMRIALHFRVLSRNAILRLAREQRVSTTDD